MYPFIFLPPKQETIESVYYNIRCVRVKTGFQMYSQFQCSKVRLKNAILQTMYLGCI